MRRHSSSRQQCRPECDHPPLPLLLSTIRSSWATPTRLTPSPRLCKELRDLSAWGTHLTRTTRTTGVRQTDACSSTKGGCDSEHARPVLRPWGGGTHPHSTNGMGAATRTVFLAVFAAFSSPPPPSPSSLPSLAWTSTVRALPALRRGEFATVSHIKGGNLHVKGEAAWVCHFKGLTLRRLTKAAWEGSFTVQRPDGCRQRCRSTIVESSRQHQAYTKNP